MTADKPIVNADTVVDIWTVVIKRQHTAITLTTVLSPQRLHSLTRMTQTTQWVCYALLTPIFKPRHLQIHRQVVKHTGVISYHRIFYPLKYNPQKAKTNSYGTMTSKTVRLLINNKL